MPAFGLLVRVVLCLLLAGTAVAKDATPPLPERKPAPIVPPPRPAAATLLGTWSLRAVHGPDGAFRYCLAEAVYEGGRTVILARASSGALNLGVGVPGARLTGNESWPMTITVDATPPLTKTAVAARADLVVAALGSDEEFAGRLGDGRSLIIEFAGQRYVFALNGSRATTAGLKSCADRKGEGVTTVVEGQIDAFPAPLAAMLDAAGLRGVRPIDLSAYPETERPADFAWRSGPVMGGVREQRVPENANLTAMAKSHLEALSARCEEPATTLGEPETMLDLVFVTGSLDCRREKRQIHAALLYYVTKANRFTVFFHEAAAGDAVAANAARDGLVRVLRGIPTVSEPASKQRTVDSDAPAMPAK